MPSLTCSGPPSISVVKPDVVELIAAWPLGSDLGHDPDGVVGAVGAGEVREGGTSQIMQLLADETVAVRLEDGWGQ